MQRAIGALLAFALASGGTPSRAATVVLQPQAPGFGAPPALTVGPAGLETSGAETVPLGSFLPAQASEAPPLPASPVPSDAPAPPAQAAPVASLPATPAHPPAVSALEGTVRPAERDPSVPAQASADPARPAGPSAFEELKGVESAGSASRPEGASDAGTFHREFYDGGSLALSGVQADAVNQTSAFLDHLEQVRLGVAGALPEAARNHRYLLLPGLNWDVGPGYFGLNLGRLSALGLKASMVYTDPLAGAQTNVEAIRRAIEESKEPVVLIAHSKGGTDLHEALAQFPHLKARIRAIVTLQSPHFGTQIADWFASRLPLYYLVMAIGRLLNPLRMFVSDPARWRDGIRQLTTSHRAGLDHGARALGKEIGLFSIVSRANPAGLAGRLKAMLFKGLHARDNDGIVGTAEGVMPGSTYAVLENVGHLAMVLGSTWRTRLYGVRLPYENFAADVTEAIVRWVHSDGRIPDAVPAKETESRAVAVIGAATPGRAEPAIAFRSHFRNALVLGISLAIFVPLLWKAATPTMFVYQVPTAFLLAGFLGLVIYAPRALAWVLWHSLAIPAWAGLLATRLARWGAGRALGREGRKPSLALPGFRMPVPRSPLGLLALGSALGAAAGITGVWYFAAVSGLVLLQTMLMAFSAVTGVWAGAQAIRLAFGIFPPLGAWFGKRARGMFSGSRIFLGRLLFAGGFLAGLTSAALPFLAPYFPVLRTGRVGLMFLLAGWVLWALAELVTLAYDAAAFLWRNRSGGLLPFKRGILRYGARFLLGLGLGAAPVIFSGPLVKTELGLLDRAAKEVAARKDIMGALPQEWQWAIRLMAESGQLSENALYAESVYFEGPKGQAVGRLGPRTLARVYLPENAEGKHLTILISGGSQTVNEPNTLGRQSLMAYLYYALSARGQPVIWFRSGDPLTQLHGRAEADGVFFEDPKVILAHTRVVARDVIQALRPSGVSIVGYSWGGGEILDLSRDQDWLGGVRVRQTIAIDPIRTTLGSMGQAETRRPDFHGNRHTQIYQQDPSRSDWWDVAYWMREQGWSLDLSHSQIEIHGAPLAEPEPEDRSEQVPGADHMGIEQIQEVQKKVLRYLGES